MNNCSAKYPFRKEHKFVDFLWFVSIGGMAEVIACIAIAQSSLLWMGIYIACMLPFGVAEVGFLCVHCPYYGQHEGRTVHCKAMWGPTKFFKPKPGPLSRFDKLILYSFFVFAFLFPMYWLIPHPVLLALYLWSILNMVWTLGRYECTRCMHFHCPFNLVSKEMKKDIAMKSNAEDHPSDPK
jgi:hypothetical protein